MNTPLTDIAGHVQTFRPGQNSTAYPCSYCDSRLRCAILSDGSGGSWRYGRSRGSDLDLLQGVCAAYRSRLQPNFTDGFLGKFLHNGKTSIRAGWGLFYNPIEQLVLEQFGAEPPFGGSSSAF